MLTSRARTISGPALHEPSSAKCRGSCNHNEELLLDGPSQSGSSKFAKGLLGLAVGLSTLAILVSFGDIAQAQNPAPPKPRVFEDLRDERGKTLDAKALTKLGRAATAYVEVAITGKGLASGSAFCVHPSGLFITNSHVVKNATGDIRIVLNPSTPEQKVLTAKVLRSDEADDLALLQVTEKAEFQALELGNVDALSELQTLVAFGFPFGNRLAITDKEYASITVNSLKISSLRSKTGKLYRIQLDGALNPGNSGGPVLDEEGRVVGVVVSGIRGTGLAEAIPVSVVSKLLATPTLSFSHPKLSIKDQGKLATFEARVATFTSGGKLEVELLLQAGAHSVKVPMTGKGDTFSASAIALPAASTAALAATVGVDGATIPVKLEERKFQVGTKTVELGTVSQIDLSGTGVVTLTDGTRLTGPVSGLGEVTATFAGQKVTFDLGKASKVVVVPREMPTSVVCTVVVRVDGKEATRQEHTISVDGVSRVSGASGGRPGTPLAPALAGDKIDLPLPSTTDQFCVGGNGRYVILRLPKDRKLAIFDASVAKVVKYLPLPEDNAQIAAGQEKLFIALPNSNAIQRYDLETFEKEITAPITTKTGAVSHMLMGSASRGPLLIIAGNDRNRSVLFLNAATLKPIEFKNAKDDGRQIGMPSDQLSRVSPDGTTFTWWGTGSPGGFNTLTINNDIMTHVYAHTTYGHLTPSPDGKIVYTGRGAFTAQGKGLNGAHEGPNSENYLVPALHGRYYLRVPTGSFPYRGKSKGPPTLHIEGDVRPLVTLKDVEVSFEVNPWDREKIGADQRFMLIPSAKMLAVLPATNDRLVLYKLDIDAAIEASGIDYLLVTSSPITAVKRGDTYSYDIAVKAKKGGVKYKVESGPEGMKVEANGKLTWAVPADFPGKTADVLLTITDSAGQEIFHSFQVSVD